MDSARGVLMEAGEGWGMGRWLHDWVDRWLYGKLDGCMAG